MILLIVLGVLAFLGLLLVAAVEAIDRWASAEAPYQDTSRGTRRD